MSDLAICPKCNGDGWIINQGARVGWGILTFGMGALLDIAATSHPKDSMFSYECPICKGDGVLDMSSYRRKPKAGETGK